jgi:hypothetical protein
LQLEIGLTGGGKLQLAATWNKPPQTWNNFQPGASSNRLGTN